MEWGSEPEATICENPERGSVSRTNVRSSTRSNSFLFVPFGEVDRPAAIWAARQRRPSAPEMVLGWSGESPLLCAEEACGIEL
jgi:hypothetical protein